MSKHQAPPARLWVRLDDHQHTDFHGPRTNPQVGSDANFTLLGGMLGQRWMVMKRLFHAAGRLARCLRNFRGVPQGGAANQGVGLF
ncbi:MAG: hypothetical protein JWR69_4488 [Pedosphaera sp.]|nr:hypothetical protein [Pedosphaera sp.]